MKEPEKGLATEQRSEKEIRKYHGSRLWESNVYGAVADGLGGGILMVVMALIILWRVPLKFEAVWLPALLIINAVVAFLTLYRGNYVAKWPYAVVVDPGSGLRLFAPYKEIYIPISEIKDIRKSFLDRSYVVRLCRRRGVLKSFVIPWLFGGEREALAQAIRRAIEPADTEQPK